MKIDFSYLAGVVFWAALGGASVWLYQVGTEKKAVKSDAAAARSAQREHSVAAIVRAGPKTEVWNTPQGDVIKLDVPYASVGGFMVEIKHCLLWRDVITKTSAMHCEQNQLDTRDYSGDGPDYSDLR